MILKGSQRSGAQQLAAHILSGKENEHIEIHEVRGFMSEKPAQAFREMHAISQGTRCKQFMFSLNLSPPAHESVSVDVFEKAIADVEKSSAWKASRALSSSMRKKVAATRIVSGRGLMRRK